MDVEGRLASYRCIRGNVETELARVADVGAGCGCAYLASVEDDKVRRSNLILEVLRAMGVDALALPYDTQAFLQRWPPGSAAHRSYFHRIVAGPDACMAQARSCDLAWSESA